VNSDFDVGGPPSCNMLKPYQLRSMMKMIHRTFINHLHSFNWSIRLHLFLL
jgi:hypothetical protein